MTAQIPRITNSHKIVTSIGTLHPVVVRVWFQGPEIYKLLSVGIPGTAFEAEIPP